MGTSPRKKLQIPERFFLPALSRGHSLQHCILTHHFGAVKFYLKPYWRERGVSYFEEENQ